MRNLTVILSALLIGASIVAYGYLVSQQMVFAIREQDELMKAQLRDLHKYRNQEFREVRGCIRRP